MAVGIGGPTASELHIEYHPHPDATPEAEAWVLANVYRFVLERVDRERATETGNDGEDAGDE